MTNDDKIAQLERRLQELEGYLSQFSSFKNYRKQDKRNNTAAIATTNIKQKPSKKTKGTRLPEDWLPTSDLVAWVKKDFPLVDLDLETAKFVDYWVSRADRGAIKLSWDRTFRNWIRTASRDYRSKHETHKRSDKLDFNSAVLNSFD